MKSPAYWQDRLVERNVLKEVSEDGRGAVTALIREIQQDAYTSGQDDLRGVLARNLTSKLLGV